MGKIQRKHVSAQKSAHYTGGIKRFSAKEIFGKILKVSHIYLGFSPDKNNNQIKHSQRVSLEFSESNFENSDKAL